MNYLMLSLISLTFLLLWVSLTKRWFSSKENKKNEIVREENKNIICTKENDRSFLFFNEEGEGEDYRIAPLDIQKWVYLGSEGDKGTCWDTHHYRICKIGRSIGFEGGGALYRARDKDGEFVFCIDCKREVLSSEKRGIQCL